MEDIKKSILESLDGKDLALLPFLPYILQDLWEFGADPEIMVSLIKENINIKNLKVLDIGCGKGAVSINIAKELKCNSRGIDAIPEFIESAKIYAKKYNVHDLCVFEVGDIRIIVKGLNGFDVAILGAIGPILGNLHETLIILKQVLNEDGYVLLDDAYIEDKSQVKYNRCLQKTDFYNQIKSAGFEIIQEIIFDKNSAKETDKSDYIFIEKRVNELIKWYPHKKELFVGYLKSQEFENNMLENELVTGTWLLRLKKLS
jgi:SAM-dependent methyltransferase